MSAFQDYLRANGFLTTETFGINLTPDGSRSVSVTAPLVLSPAELFRIRAWLGLQFIIEKPLTPGEVNFGDMIGG